MTRGSEGAGAGLRTCTGKEQWCHVRERGTALLAPGGLIPRVNS